MGTNTLTHKHINAALERVDAAYSASEGHGLLCGMLCAGGKEAQQDWLSQMMPDKDPSDVLANECQRLLDSVCNETERELCDELFDFNLLLPDDERALVARTESLAQWCQGFIFGLGIGGLTNETRLPQDSAELIHDLQQISHAGFDSEEELADEEAYMQLVEYVRVGTVLLYEELSSVRESSELPVTNTPTSAKKRRSQ